MALRVQIVSILCAVGLFGLIFELVRRRRLMERYALLWLLSATTLLALSVWRGLLDLLATAIGVAYAPSALFLVALALGLLLVLHFSLVISRLTDQNKVLAQRIGILQHQVDDLRMAQELGQPPVPTAEDELVPARNFTSSRT